MNELDIFNLCLAMYKEGLMKESTIKIIGSNVVLNAIEHTCGTERLVTVIKEIEKSATEEPEKHDHDEPEEHEHDEQAAYAFGYRLGRMRKANEISPETAKQEFDSLCDECKRIAIDGYVASYEV